MGARRKTERALAGMAGVEVEADGEQGFEHRARRPGVGDAVLVRPGRVVGMLRGPREREDQVLVPRHLPVHAWRLVEGDGLDGGGRVRQGKGPADAQGELADGRLVQQATGARPVAGEKRQERVEAGAGQLGSKRSQPCCSR